MNARLGLLVTALSIGNVATASADATCVRPVDNDRLSKPLAAGPHFLAERTLAVGGKLAIGGLKLRLSKRLMADWVGATTGEWVTDLTGEAGGHSDFTTVPGMFRIGTYRITARRKGAAFALRIEDGVCEPEHVEKPLAPGESRSFWMSTEGTRLVDLREAESWNSGDTLELSLGFGFNHNGSYSAYMGMELHRYRAGWHADRSLDFSDDLPKPSALDDHTVEIVRIVWGPNTKVVQGEILPIETTPVAHVLVKLTRNR